MKNRNLALLALTGILTLAACSTGPTTPNPGTTPPGDGGTTTPPGGGTTTPVPSSLTIISPANGASVTNGQPIQVTYSTSVALTNVTCTIAGGTAVAASNSTSGGFCTVTPTVAGSNVITVSGKNAAGETVSQSVAVNATVAATSPIIFDPAQELTLTSEGIVKDADNGWRRLGQGVTTPGNPDTNIDVYIKGIVNVSYNAPAGAKVEVILARTTGSDVPTSDDIQAGDVLRVVTSASGPVTAVLDSTRLAEFEAVREWLVFRVNGTQVFFQPVIADNKGPQQAAPKFNGVQNTYSAIRRDYNGTNINWARGDISIFTSNPSLQDREYGQAPAGASFAQRRPAGFESIRYYLVPETAFSNKALQDSDEMLRAKAIKSVATIVSAPVLEPGADRTSAFSTAVGSGSTSTVAPKALDNVTYRIYTISRDQLGNETGSASYENVRFDNVGPVITGSGLLDTSILPFPSQEPTRCLSDEVNVTLGNATDNAGGIGVINQPSFNLGGINIPASGTFDTNRLADGNYKIDYSTLTDVLGNPATGTVNSAVFIDNTDPTANFNRPVLQARVNSGERLSVESDFSDGGCGIYETRLFWDTNVTNATNDAATTAAIGHPVEFARKTLTDGAKASSLNQGWNVLQLPSTAGAVILRAMAIDRAGNATLVNTPIVVTSKATNYLPIVLGGSDGYRRLQNATLGSGYGIAALDANGTTLIPNLGTDSRKDNSLTLDASRTVTANGSSAQPLPSPTPVIVEKLNAVMAYGRFDAVQWGAIRTYQLAGDPTLTRTGSSGDLINQRTANWNVRNPWVELGDSATADSKQQFTFTSDLVNNFYFGRTFDNTTPAVPYTYDQFNGIVTDTSGSYVYFGEEVSRTTDR